MSSPDSSSESTQEQVTPESLRQLGLAATEQGRLEEAVELFRKLLELRPDDDIARNNLGCLLLELEEVDDAVKVLGSALPGGVDGIEVPALRSNLGYALLSQGDLHRSERVFRRILEEEPDNADARNHLGLTLLRRAHWEDAITELSRVVREHPAKVEALINLGCAYQGRGDLEAARTTFERALQVDPYNVDAHNNLGCVLRDQGDVTTAIEELQLAVNLEPRNPAIHLNLSLCFKKAEQAQEALSHLRRYLRYGEQTGQVDGVHRMLRALEAEVGAAQEEVE